MNLKCDECGEEFEVLENEIDGYTIEGIECPECGYKYYGEESYDSSLEPGDYGYTGEYDEEGEFIHPCGNSWDY